MNSTRILDGELIHCNWPDWPASAARIVCVVSVVHSSRLALGVTGPSGARQEVARELSSRTQTRHHSLLPHIAPGSQHRATDRHWTLTCDGRFGSQCFSGRWSASATLPIFQRRPASDGREGHLLQHCIHPPFPPHNPPLPLRVNYVAYCAHDMHTRAGWCTEKRGGEGAGGRWLTDPLHLPFQPPRSSPVVPRGGREPSPYRSCTRLHHNLHHSRLQHPPPSSAHRV